MSRGGNLAGEEPGEGEEREGATEDGTAENRDDVEEVDLTYLYEPPLEQRTAV